MPETHRLSYFGDPTLVSVFVELLDEEGVATHEESISVADQARRDPTGQEPLSLLVSGDHDLATDSIARAITTFSGRFPGRAEVHDDGRMPTRHLVRYVGNPSFVEDFIDLLSSEQIEVSEPEADDDWPSVDQQVAQDSGQRVSVEMWVLGWGDISVGISAAIAEFQSRHPGQAEIRDEQEGP